MQVHKERLIESGLLSPLSLEEIVKRMGVLLCVENGVKIPAEEVPNFVVFRADKPFAHIASAGYKRCEDAELIADYLYYDEAYRLCRTLVNNDHIQPDQPHAHFTRFGMYKICTHNEWDAWMLEKSEINIFNSEERE
jgi:hypothetical protein